MVELMLDKDWTDDGPSFGKAVGDTNVYTTGVLSDHNVVLCYMPGMGGNNAAACAASLRISFPKVEIAFVVGICGVAPKDPQTGEHVILGDCIISTAATQYDFGRQYPDGFSIKTSVDDSLSRANAGIRAAISKLRTRRNIRKLTDKLVAHLQDLQQREPDLRHPGMEKDRLFRSDYDHGQHLPNTRCTHCDKDTPGACSKDCNEIKCDLTFTVSRTEHSSVESASKENVHRHPKVHFGRFGSANMVVKAGMFRDRITKQHDVIAFEMEGAGTWDVLPTIVIKGACDYADSHKSKEWQQYAAVVAASCLKAVLAGWESFEPEREINKNGLLGKRKATESPVRDFSLAQHTDINSSQAVDIQRRQDILKKLNFVGATDRVDNVTSGHSATCHWLKKHKLYLDWLDDSQYSTNHATLWIKGKAGSGKSTIMKYVLTEAINSCKKRQAKRNKHQEVIVSFFFNARGSELEKTIVGLYRSLLFQLFTKIPVMQEILDNGALNGPSHEYGQEILQNVLCSAMQWIDEHYQEEIGRIQVLYFIDALDECPEDQIRDMLRLFERLSHMSGAHNGHVLFRVCFSSRHYPSISMKICQELILDKQPGHLEDISKYIDAELRLESTVEAEMIKAQILEKSGQIFLWVVLVVQMLVKEYDRGRTHTMRKKLTEIPKELDKLFKDIILRDRDNVEELVLCIQWILYTEPLTISEFYFAMLWGTDPTSSNLAYHSRKGQTTLEDMQRYVLNSSKGLAEVASGKVQFIHESVREFFMKEQALVDSWIGPHSIGAGISHDRLKGICQQQLKSVAVKDYEFDDDFPFLDYAVNTLLWHADRACSYGVSQVTFLEDFPLQRWLEHKDHLNTSDYTSTTSLLYILAEEDLPYLIRQEIVRNPMCNQPGNEQYELPIYAALAKGNTAAVVELLKPTPVLPVDCGIYGEAVYSARLILQINPPRRGQCPASWLTEHQPKPDKLVRFLLSCTDWIDFQDVTEWLHMATRYNDIEVVEKLLQRKDIKLDTCNYEGCTPLYVAAREGHTEIARHLLAKGASVEKGQVNDDSRQSPLLAATRYGHEDVFHMLLDNNADAFFADENGLTALHVAGYRDNISMVRRLSKHGPSLETRNRNGWLPLHMAAFHGSLQVLGLMLNTMVSIDTPTTVGGYTAMWLAARNGHDNVVQWLIEKKANVQINADGHWTLLHAAVASKSPYIFRLLLQAGATNIPAETFNYLILWPSSGISGVAEPLDFWDWLRIVRMSSSSIM